MRNWFECLERTALHCACQNGHESVVRMLLEAGADINEDEVRHVSCVACTVLTDSVSGKCGWTALHKACIGAHFEFLLNVYFGKKNPSVIIFLIFFN